MADDITVSEGPEELEPMSDSSGGAAGSAGGLTGGGGMSTIAGNNASASTLGKEVKSKSSPAVNEEGEEEPEEEHLQFEECDVKTCIYYNEEGYCSYETCRIKIEDPAVAAMITKTCQFCFQPFVTNLHEMTIQMCPACKIAALKAEKHPHNCIFCGRTMDVNPRLFFPMCEKCKAKFLVVINGSTSSTKLAFNSAHC